MSKDLRGASVQEQLCELNRVKSKVIHDDADHGINQVVDIKRKTGR